MRDYMKYFKASIIFLFLLIMSVGVVCAEDANQTSQDTLGMTDSDVISDAPGTYDDLYNNISQSSGSISLEKDYKYNKEKDTKRFIEFNNTNYVIEGNNHIIDADGKTSVFKIYNSNLTMQNLILRNCNDSAIILYGSNLITINVTFENNNVRDIGGAVYCEDSVYSSSYGRFINNTAKYSGGAVYCKGNLIMGSIFKSNNDEFIDNTASDEGSSIYGDNSVLHLNHTSFANKNSINWSVIYGKDSMIEVFETVFGNITSRYATAIYSNLAITVKKSKFINLHASETAGAIAIKGPGIYTKCNLTVMDCEFTNVSATKNGGAIFADINGDNNKYYQNPVKISNTTFSQCSGDFGGALLQLGGTCEITDSKFINNMAKDNGGAVYISNSTVFISKTEFANNKAHEIDGMGGALYLDYGGEIVDNCIFENNTASKGGAIYSFQNIYTIKNSKFENNNIDIYTCFDDEGSAITNCGEPQKVINDTTLPTTIRYNGEPIILNPLPISGSASDSYFNLRDQGLVTPVKNQGSMGACWAFGAAGAFESAFLIATNITLDLSENNIQNLGLRYSVYGNTMYIEGASYETSASYFVSWLGGINTTADTYDELGKISSLNYSPNSYRVLDALFVDIKDKNAIKNALTAYGAMNLFIYGSNPNGMYYNKNTSSIYNDNENNTGNHYVTLVGWNDTYSRDNFLIKPDGDGAWICKNSWGTEWGDGGYFYLSYYDKSLTEEAVGFSFENVEHYEKIYQNEATGLDSYTSKYDTYGQIFTSDYGDLIAAVGTYFEKANTPYTISVYVNNYLAYTQSGKSHHGGYNTLKLNKLLAVDANSTFEIKIESSSVPLVGNSRMPIVRGTNYIIVNGEVYDPSSQDTIVPVKAYTYKNPEISKNIVKYYANKETIFTVTDVEGDSLLVSFKGDNYTIPIKNGVGNLSLGVLPVGEYLVTVHYKNQTFDNQVLIKTSIETGDTESITIGYNTELGFTVKYLDENGNPLKNIAVTAKFDGKSISGTITDAEGLLTITVYKGNNIGNHYLDYTNPVTSENVTVIVKIISRFSGNKNVNMYYCDGSSYNVRIVGDNGKFVGKNKAVTIKIGKQTFKVRTNANGYATLKIPKTITPGEYIIAATYAGQTVKNKLIVKQVLKTVKTVTVKKSAKKLVLKAALKKGKTALKNKVIKFKVNGKIYKAKTNKKGIAQVIIKKADINKLNIKKYAINVSYLNDVVKSILIVRS